MSEPRPASWGPSRSPRLQRRHDYPEPLYVTPRSPQPGYSPPISPMSLVPAPLEPWRRQLRPDEDSLYSREQHEERPGDPKMSPSEVIGIVLTSAVPAEHDQPPPRRRQPTRLFRAGVYSAISMAKRLSALHEAGYSQAAAEPARIEGDDLQDPHADTLPREGGIASRLSAMYIFGQGTIQAISTAQAPAQEMPTPEPASPSIKLPSKSTHNLRPVITAVTITNAAKEAEMAEALAQADAPPKRRRFDSLRRSVADISASLKQAAGRKRSREDSHHAAAEEGTAKFARKACPVAPKLPVLNTDILRPLDFSSDQQAPDDLPAEPTCSFRPRLLRVTRLLDVVERPSRVSYAEYGQDLPSPDGDLAVGWTREEREDFGAYVRAAEGEEGREWGAMDLE